MSTHFKKTNTFQYLFFSSSRPRGVLKGLVKGEAIRFLRSNTDTHTYYSTLHIFREHLLLRNYPRVFRDRLLDGITHDLRASYIPNLTPSPSPSPSPTPSPTVPRLVTTYSPHYTSLIRKNTGPLFRMTHLSLLSSPLLPSSGTGGTPLLLTLY